MPSELAARPIAWVGAAIAATVVLVVCGVFLLLHLWNAPHDPSRVQLPYAVQVPPPTLQSAPQLDLARYRAEKQHVLDTAAWVDATHGIARIPIADAMAMLGAVGAQGANAAALVATPAAPARAATSGAVAAAAASAASATPAAVAASAASAAWATQRAASPGSAP